MRQAGVVLAAMVVCGVALDARQGQVRPAASPTPLARVVPAPAVSHAVGMTVEAQNALVSRY